MANTITKFQASYLRDRLMEIRDSKIEEFKKVNKVQQVTRLEYFYTLIKTGQVKLKPAKEIKGVHSWGTPSVSELFDIKDADKEYDKVQGDFETKVNNYSDTLKAAMTAIIDSVVLQGLGIDEAIAKFKSL